MSMKTLDALLQGAGLAAGTEEFASSTPSLHSKVKPIFIFGAGQNGRKVQNLCRLKGLSPVAFIDDTPAKQGLIIDGLPVQPRAALGNLTDATVIVSIFSPHIGFRDIARKLEQPGLRVMSLFQFLVAEAQDSLPFYFLACPSYILAHREEACSAATLFADDQSRDLYQKTLVFRLVLDHTLLPETSKERLPPPDAWNRLVYIDCGAFDGDTLLPFLATYKQRISRAIAIEPDPTNFSRLQANLAASEFSDPKFQVSLIPAAVDEVSARKTFENGAQQGSHLSESGEIEVQTLTLDRLIGDEPGEIYIKLDVEGNEFAALQGATSLAEKESFLIAVSVYHKPADIWRFPIYLKGRFPESKLLLRSHGEDGADLMLYCIKD